MMIFFYIFLMASCTKKSEVFIDEVPIIETGEVKIKAQDDRFYPFSLKADSVYTLSFDFTNYNYEPQIEQDGWGHRIKIDWGVLNQHWIYEFSIGSSYMPQYKCPKSSICIIPKEDIILRVNVFDMDYSDNTGYALITMSAGSVGFDTGTHNSSMSGKIESKFPVSLLSGEATTISVDFSEHTSDLPGGEPRGWKHSYWLEYGGSALSRLFEIGTPEDPKIFVPKTSLTIISNGSNVIKYTLMDSDLSNNDGDIYFNW